jgi:hypothetical protein
VRLLSTSVVIAVQFIIGAPAAMCQESKDQPTPHMRIDTPNGAIFLEASNLDRRREKHKPLDTLQYFPTIHLSGNVVIQTACSLPSEGPGPICLTLRADEAEYREDTGELRVSGAVRVRFEPSSK